MKNRLRLVPASLAAAAVALAVVASAAWTTPAFGAAADRGPGAEAIARIEPRLDRQLFAEALDAARPDRETRSIIDTLYADYVDGLARLAEELETARDEAGADEVDSALTGRRLVDPARLRGLRAAVREADRPGFDRADTLVRDLLDSVSIMLVDDAAEAFEARLPDLRRVLYLHPRRQGGFEPTYVGDGVDLVELARELPEAAGLAGFDPAVLEPILADYAAALDAILPGHAAADWQGRIDLAVARITRDDRARRAAEVEAIGRWERLFSLTDDAAKRIERTLEEQVGATAALVWRERYERACFPWLWQTVRPEEEFRWIRRRIEDAEVQDRALQIYQQFRVERGGLAADTMRVVVTARREHGTILDPRIDPLELDGAAADLFRRLLRTSGEIEQLDQAASDALNGLLDAGERGRMRADVNAVMFRGR